MTLINPNVEQFCPDRATSLTVDTHGLALLSLQREQPGTNRSTQCKY